jgi:MraZ protein
VARSGAKGRNLIVGFWALRGALWERSPVARFFGRYEHSLDDKGRVILPSKFRTHFEHGGYLTQFTDGCLSLWTPDQFEAQMESMLERAASGKSDRNLVRLWASTSHEMEIDRQGRMAIPGHLREYAGLAGDVLVLGAIDRVELWNREAWDSKVLPEEARLTQGDDD